MKEGEDRLQGLTLKSYLFRMRPKDTVEPTGQDSIVYRIPYECGKDYTGRTGDPSTEEYQGERLTRIYCSSIPTQPPPFLSIPMRLVTILLYFTIITDTDQMGLDVIAILVTWSSSTKSSTTASPRQNSSPA